MATNKKETGVIYVAFGYEYLIMALNSFRSLKKQHKDLPVTIVTNIPIKNTPGENIKDILNITNSNKIFDKVYIVDDESRNNRLYKTNIYEFTPYEKTLYLDVDTEIKSSIRHGFKFLNFFDVAFTFAPYPITTMVDSWDGDAHLEEMKLKNACRWNGGIFFFDDSKETIDFFDRWRNTYETFGYEADQFSLIHSIYNSSVRIMSLDLSWNANKTTMKFDESIESRLKIHHHSGRLWKLRSFENSIGEGILDIDDRTKQEDLRADFQDKYKISEEVKVKLRYIAKRFWS